MKFLIALLIIAVIIVAAFAVWFFIYLKNGGCPVCALKKVRFPSKMTIDVQNEAPYANSAAKTPPMGWSSWNTFRQNISEELICDTALAMKFSGLLDAGYKYLNIDDCWQSSMRDGEGRLQADLERFPSGMSALISKINTLGIKVGLYSSNGTLTCEDMPASLGKEMLDAETIALWGCEFFKYDFCHHVQISGSAPAVEAIEISRPGSRAELTLYPQDADFEGRAQIVKIKKLNSKQAIGRLNHGAGSATFHPVVSQDGEYVLTFLIYKSASAKEKYLQISVNGNTYEIFFPKTKAPSPTGRGQVTVNMKSGVNELIIKNPVVTMADSSYIQYKRMGDALLAGADTAAKKRGDITKPIIFSICEWGFNFPWHWGAKAGNMWRTTPDIFAKWLSINTIYRRNIRLYKYSSPGAWNDPDMLEVGNASLTEDENKTHFSLWCMMAAPLILGNDIRKFVDENGNADSGNKTLQIVTNKELIAIDQDPLGKSAKLIQTVRGIDILARPLANGDIALCFYNKTKSDRGITFDIGELANDEYLDMTPNQSVYAVHELFSGEQFNSKTVSISLAKHASKVFRIKQQ
ncbi:MAG: alpha-galactosidase [Clostridiales bacterium]|nr:alpha-galactosidase [Clostridiales bacterium]